MQKQTDDIEHDSDAGQPINNTLQKRSSVSPVIQLAGYMRALTAEGKVGGEIASLRREFTKETNREHQVNTWVDGFAGMPTARNTGDDKNYFSPVGYKLETNNDADVLANYTGDGNTNDIPVGHANWLPAAQAMRTAVLQVPDYVAWAAASDEGQIPPVDGGTIEGIRNDYINYFLKPYLEEAVAGAGAAARQAGQAAVVAAIKASGINAIRTHYDTRPAMGQPTRDRFMGSGVSPAGMDAAAGDAGIPYIESILHAKFNQVTAAWFNHSPGNYADAAAQASWRSTDAAWLSNRRASAQAIQTAFNAVPGTHVDLQEIGPAVPAPAVQVVGGQL